MATIKLTAAKRGVTDDGVNEFVHRAAANEGEAARRLLEGQGYELKRRAGGQYTTRCPFHEGPGKNKRSANFYIDGETSVFYCHSATCGERGNLLALERFFGIEASADPAYRTKEVELQEYESALTHDLRTPFYKDGIDDDTITRFRIGYDPFEECYVIPYLEGRRPIAFRFYDPDEKERFGKPMKYWWEKGANITLFNAHDAVGDADGRVFIAEGEKKAMLLCQLGYAAVAVPGAGMFKDEWFKKFNDARKVIIVFDNDNPVFHDKGAECPRCDTMCTGHNPGQEAATKLLDQFGWRAINVLLPLPDEDTRKTDVNEYFVRDGHTALDFAEMALGEKKTQFQVQTLSDIMESPPDEASMLIEQGILSVGGRLLIAGRPKVGKMSSLDTPILTPTGWTTMGELSPGDSVIGADGHPTAVTHVHPQGRMPLYKVHLSDGTWTDAGAEHLWDVQTHHDRQAEKDDGRPRWRTMSTAQIARLLAEGKNRHTYLPMVGPVQYSPAGPLPVDPYALGLLLGDGSLVSGSPTFTKTDVELHDALAKAFPDLSLSPVGPPEKGTVNIVGSDGQSNRLTDALRDLGLWGYRSWEKFIPEMYLRAAPEDRLALIQGLCDTDGWVQWNGDKATGNNTQAHFSSSSEALADGLTELVQSLGGVARRYVKHPTCQGGEGRTSYEVRVVLPQDMEPFRLARKRDEWLSGRTTTLRPPVRRITKVEYWKDAEAQCITVANDDGLYVTNDYIVTHNSILAEHMALSLAAGIPFLGKFKVDHPTRVLLLDRELSPRSLYDRLMDLMKWKPGYRAAAENLCIDHDHLLKLDMNGALELLTQLVEQNGAEVVMFDTAYKFISGDMESSGRMSKAFDVLDRLMHKTGCSVVLTHHLRKSQSDSKQGQNTDVADPDRVAGTFLWTGWPNATMMLNFLNRSVEDPFNASLTFTAFRDAPPPDGLALYRGKETLGYTSITDLANAKALDGERKPSVKPTRESVAEAMLELAPLPELDMLERLCIRFNVSASTVRPFVIEAIADGHFKKTTDFPPVIKFAYERVEESWEEGRTKEQLRLVKGDGDE